ncbi:nitrate- and nitrite sensing domain-containing protein [Streptomyces sp. ODS28]|uniref:sensor histidine kinase n=1 Tax=Streptomyces sp. ODS28 TaxID=3136688 RepID=UPI0031E9B1D3
MRGFRGKSIRRKIVVLLLVPLVSLVSIWGFATYLTSREAVQLLSASDAMNQVGQPTEQAARAIQRERRQILVYLADPRQSDALTRLHKQQRETDAAVQEIRSNAADEELRSGLSTRSRKTLASLVDNLDELSKVRARVGENTITRGGAYQAYNQLVDSCYEFAGSLNGLNDVELEKQGRALIVLTRAREYLSREDALMAAAFASGEMTRGDQRAFSDRVAERNLAYDTNLSVLPAEDRDAYEEYWNGTDGRTLRNYEDTIIAAGPRGTQGAVTADRWESATSTVLTDLERLAYESNERYQQRVDPSETQVILRAVAAGVLGCIAVLASLIISVRVGRGLVRDLNTLRKEANESAGVRLPSVMRRLAAGEQVDVQTEAPELVYPPDEMGQVGKALNTLQRSAVEAAVKQADMRRGVSEVFVNLARRNQVLLHRQLTLLDAMERRTENSDELADLFRLDHLTTRMRRHAEGLVILSGSAPSRQWRKPVQLMDVVRAAVAEVEDYERIEVRRLPRLAVDGGAVADLTHLIAELLENATVFSPPHTAVQVLGERVANGFTLEIHDRGLGMPPEVLLDANLRLAETPEFELSDTDRLGLFVVSRLAQRQGVRVSLQTSPYGGTTAVVLIPGTILTETQGRDDERGQEELDGDRSEQLPTARARRLEIGTRRGALDGPIELEAPLEEGAAGDGLFRTESARQRAGAQSREQGREQGREHSGHDHTPAIRKALGGEGPDEEQHQQARDEAEHSRPAPGPESAQDEEDGPAPLPRRTPQHGAPVLVAENGRTVSAPGRLPRREKRKDPERNAIAAASKTSEDGATSGDAAATEPGVEQREDSRTESRAGTTTDTDTGTGNTSTGNTGTGNTGTSNTGTGSTGTNTGISSGDTLAGLPRRVRQASLAPQLKREPGGASAREEGGAAERDARGADSRSDAAGWDRDADEVRNRMASLQRGWQRGRRDNAERAEDGADGAPGEASGESAQGTTPEGDAR